MGEHGVGHGVFVHLGLVPVKGVLPDHGSVIVGRVPELMPADGVAQRPDALLGGLQGGIDHDPIFSSGTPWTRNRVFAQ